GAPIVSEPLLAIGAMRLLLPKLIDLLIVPVPASGAPFASVSAPAPPIVPVTVSVLLAVTVVSPATEEFPCQVPPLTVSAPVMLPAPVMLMNAPLASVALAVSVPVPASVPHAMLTPAGAV